MSFVYSLLMVLLLTFLVISSPLAMLISVVLSSLLAGVLIFLCVMDSWLSYLTLLLILSGVLILYAYVVATLSPEPESKKSVMGLLSLVVAVLILVDYSSSSWGMGEGVMFKNILSGEWGSVYIGLFIFVLVGFVYMTLVMSSKDKTERTV